MIRLPLRQRHESLGARFAPFAGWEMPLQYQGIIAEHQTAREGVGVFDISHLGRAWVKGPGAGSRLRSVTTFDVTSIKVGAAYYSLYCNESGGIEDDVIVYHVGEESWLVVHNASNAVSDFERLRAVAPDQAVEVTAETVMLAIQGPDAVPLLSQVFDIDVGGWKPRQCGEIDWKGGKAFFARTGYTGEEGGECVVPAEHAEALWDALLSGGATPCGLGARDTLRLEAALPLYGNELDPTILPFEAGLGFAVTFQDGAPFTGRSALIDAQTSSPIRKLTHLAARDRGVPRAGFPVHAPEVTEPIAYLTSGTFSPSLRHGIAMAYLPVAYAKPGLMLEVDVRGRALPVVVVNRPFYRKSRPS